MFLDEIEISKDVRKYWKETGFEPTPEQWLVIIWNHWDLPFYRKIEMMEELSGEFDEGTKARLLRFIRLKKEALEQLKENADRKCIFYLEKWEEEDREYEEVCHTWSFEKVQETVRLTKTRHHAAKIIVTEDEVLPDEDGEYDDGAGYIQFDEEGNISHFYNPLYDGCTKEDEKFEEGFLSQYIALPYPFRHGDAIRLLHDEEDKRGLVIYAVSMEEQNQCRQEHLQKHRYDYGDQVLNVEWCWADDGCFCHAHISPLQLEYTELERSDPRYKIIEQAQLLMSGKGSLECFQLACEHRLY